MNLPPIRKCKIVKNCHKSVLDNAIPKCNASSMQADKLREKVHLIRQTTTQKPSAIISSREMLYKKNINKNSRQKKVAVDRCLNIKHKSNLTELNSIWFIQKIEKKKKEFFCCNSNIITLFFIHIRLFGFILVCRIKKKYIFFFFNFVLIYYFVSFLCFVC